MTNVEKEIFATASKFLSNALEESQSDKIKIEDAVISRQKAEEMKEKFDLIANDKIQIDEEIFRIIPLNLAIPEIFWRELQVIINQEFSKNL